MVGQAERNGMGARIAGRLHQIALAIFFAESFSPTAEGLANIVTEGAAALLSADASTFLS